MKKILFASDGSNFSEGSFEFVRRLNDIQPVLLTGVFIPQITYANLWSYSAVAAFSGFYPPLPEEEDNKVVENNIKHFENLCQKNGIAYRIHKDNFDFDFPELKKESRFSDVMIISGELFYKRFIEADQDHLREVLHISECPVLVVPESYQFPDNNILAYDGSEESVYAIKQFAYLFPELTKNATLLVYAENEDDKDFPSKDYIIELATQHFSDLTFYELELKSNNYFSALMIGRKSSILMSGAFSRSALSQVFKKSFVAAIIRDHQIAVFIAHK